MQALSNRLGWDESRVHRLIGDSVGGVSPVNAAKIAALYEQLWYTPAPRTCRGERIGATRAARAAARRGFIPPLGWDDIDNDAEPAVGEPVDLDEIAIERLIHGDDVPVTKAERLEAVRIMAAQGLNNTQIGERLGIGNNGAFYIRKRHLERTA